MDSIRSKTSRGFRQTGFGTTTRALTLALVVAADAVFLWMFLSADPLERIAASLDSVEAMAAMRFAADWRHGMAGNAWIYMPGFFATAAALWLHARHALPAVARGERILAALVALALAFAGALPGSSGVVRAFGEASGIALPAAVPVPSFAAVISGVYTLATWSVFVLACRGALVRRTLRPFVPAAIMTAGLAVLRPWTVDDFTTHWAGGIAAADPRALASLALVFVVSALLVAHPR